MPKVSVVIPNYNHARFLGRRIESVLAQTLTDLEVILMDDCSTDHSREVIARYASDPRVRVELNEQNSGSTFKQWNKGLRLARGEFVWIAESDDWAQPRLLERVVGALEANACGIGCCESWLMFGEDDPEEAALSPLLHPRPRRRLWETDFVADGATVCVEDMMCHNALPNASAVVFRRELYERVGGADETMRQAGDWLVWVRMLSISRFAHVADRLNYYRYHEQTVRAKRSSSSATIAEVYASLRHIRDKLDVPPDKLERALAHNAAYFARASVRRGVRLREMVDACRQVSDVDPRVWRRLFAPWLVHRASDRPLRLARRVGHGVGRRLRSAA